MMVDIVQNLNLIIDENPFSRKEIRDALAKCEFGFFNPESDFVRFHITFSELYQD